MSIDIVLKLESDQAMHEYLMNHSYLYKELNRDPDYFETFLKEYKKYKREETAKKVSDAVENIETISNIISVMWNLHDVLFYVKVCLKKNNTI